jgi:hypothetical protein
MRVREIVDRRDSKKEGVVALISLLFENLKLW